jgi:hypothetical protein
MEQTPWEDEMTGEVTIDEGNGVAYCYCSNCGDHCETVEGQPVLTRMVPAAPAAAVRETLLYRVLNSDAWRNNPQWQQAADVFGLPPAMRLLQLHNADNTLTPAGRTILSALEGGGAVAQPSNTDISDLLARVANGGAWNLDEVVSALSHVTSLRDQLDTSELRAEAAEAELAGEVEPIPVSAELVERLNVRIAAAVATAGAVAHPSDMVPRAALQWLATEIAAILLTPQCEVEGCPAFSLCNGRDATRCPSMSCRDALCSAALAATGQAPGPTDAELWDALRGYDIHTWHDNGGCYLEACETTKDRAGVATSHGDDPRDLARAILAQRGGGTDADHA